jgi:hypothetical protein
MFLPKAPWSGSVLDRADEALRPASLLLAEACLSFHYKTNHRFVVQIFWKYRQPLQGR